MALALLGPSLELSTHHQPLGLLGFLGETSDPKRAERPAWVRQSDLG